MHRRWQGGGVPKSISDSQRNTLSGMDYRIQAQRGAAVENSPTIFESRQFHYAPHSDDPNRKICIVRIANLFDRNARVDFDKVCEDFPLMERPRSESINGNLARFFSHPPEPQTCTIR
jgi:hypothetical protein